MQKNKINFKKVAGFWVAVFLLGGLAGVLAIQVFLPWLAGITPFSKIGWIARIKDCTTIINQTEKITISQDLAYLDAIARLSNSVVGIRAEKHYRIVNKKQVLLAKPEVLAQGSGFILTGDGLIVTANSLVPETATRFIIARDSSEIEGQLVKRDVPNGLALLKINETNLPVVALGDSFNLKLGESVFVLGVDNSSSTPSKFINLGFISSLEPVIKTSLNENQWGIGSPLVNIKGEVIGLDLYEDGKDKVVTEEKIRALLK